jgi:hypothetical protein
MPLLTTNALPPGGWVYEQPKDGLPFKQFREMGPFKDFLQGILSVRTANLLPGATLAEVDSDVQNYTCARLGNDPRWCAAGTGVVTQQPTEATFYAVVPRRGCGGCGGQKIA